MTQEEFSTVPIEPWRSPAEVREFHAHVYFNQETKASAFRLYAQLKKIAEIPLVLHSIAEVSRGPHVSPMFGMDIRKADLPELLSFLVLNRGPHSILIHPVTGNELLDHTHHALWLGFPQALNLSVLV